ncbi:glycosyltransferase family A protein [Azospirillum halopraeferens]|uniref:glycosyltransferase family A protein n=1 Tax=Azospirillum halopraeferens TaxID=34010 RepID=UPI00040D1677|nr:glycosyltransferase family A protein [Azospirillum halopraeferens]
MPESSADTATASMAWFDDAGPFVPGARPADDAEERFAPDTAGFWCEAPAPEAGAAAGMVAADTPVAPAGPEGAAAQPTPDAATATAAAPTPLTEAARRGDAATVEAQLSLGADPRADGGAAPAAAAAAGHPAVLRLLHRHDAALVHDLRWTLVNAAAANGHLSVLAVLRECGVDLVDVAAAAIGAARSCGHDRIAAYLERFAAVNDLESAAAHGDAARVAQILLWPVVDRVRADAALLRAAAHGHAAVMQMLLERAGANVRTGDNAPLMAAAAAGSVAAVDVALRFGADLHARSGACVRAAAAGHDAVVRHLVRHGAVPDAHTVAVAAQNGHTALARHLYGVVAERAAAVGDTACVERLHETLPPDPEALKRAANHALLPGHAAFVRTVIDLAAARTDTAAFPAPVAAGPHAVSGRRHTVSVLLYSHNRAADLPLALQGACAQTRPADEILIVDDGSTDGSLSIIRSFERCHPGIRRIGNGGNRGFACAMNRLLHEARGDFVVLASADGRLLPEFLERNLAVLDRNPQAGLSFSHLVIDPGDGTVVDRATTMPDRFGLGDMPAYVYMPPAALAERTRRRGLPVMPANAVVARRDAVVACGGLRPDQPGLSDWFTLHAVALRYGVVAVPEALAVVRADADERPAIAAADPAERRRALLAVADALSLPETRDLRRLWRDLPAVPGMLGPDLVRVLAGVPHHWDLLAPLSLWWLRRRGRDGGPPTRHRAAAAPG